MFVASIFSVALLAVAIPGRSMADSIIAETETSISTGTNSTSSGEVTITHNTTGWGLFLLGIKERLSLLTTFDPVAKAEKALKFAEERGKIAEELASKTDDAKAQERLDRMLKRSQELEDQVDKVKDKLTDNPDARAKLLLKNLLNFKEHKEEVFSKIEEKATPEQLEKLKSFRSQAEEKGKALINALQNAKLPEDIRAHLEEVKAKIEAQQQKVKEFQEEQKALLDRVKSGDESAKEELKTLRDDRKAEVEADNKTQSETRGSVSSTKPLVRPLFKQEIRKVENRLQVKPEERMKREEEMEKKLRLRQERDSTSTQTSESE